MIDRLQDLTENLPDLLQWLGVLVAGAIPFVESYLGSVIGVVAGLHPAIAIPVAVAGNVASMAILVLGADAARDRVATARASAGTEVAEQSARRQRLRRMFDRYGVPGVSLLGQTILPSQITSAALVSFGASRAAVIRWQVVSIALWGTVFGLLASAGVDLRGGR